MSSLMAITERYLPVITAATPGAFRIFVIIFSSLFVASENMAIFSTEYTLATFFVMICGIGFSTILVKSMAQSDSYAVLLSYASSSILVGGGATVLLLFLLSFVIPVPDFFAVFVLILSTSLYQIFRNYLIFKQEFWKLLLNDFLVGFFYLSIVLGWYFWAGVLEVFQLFVFLAFAYLFSIITVFVLYIKIARGNQVDKGYVSLVSKKNTVSSLVVGMSNAASGGISFILPSFFIALGGEGIAIIASVSALVFSSIAAVPRGIINNATASLSKMVALKYFNGVLVSDLRHKVRKVIVFLFPLLSLCLLIYFYFFNEVEVFYVTAIFIGALGFYVATAQLGVVESVLVNLCGYERWALYFNALMLLTVVLVFLFARFSPVMQDAFFVIYLLPTALGIANIFRMFWYRKLAMRYFGNFQ